MTLSADMMERLEARGLDVELADRMGLSSVQRGAVGEALVLPFRRKGEIVHRKYRFFDHPDGKKWGADPGAILLPFNEDALRDETLRHLPLIVTEGEFDALAAIQCGFSRTISVPGGAPPPAERSKSDLEESAKYAWFSEIRPFVSADLAPEVIIAADGDENGAALLQDLSVLFGRYRCKFLTYPKAKDPEKRGRQRLKDLNEVLEDYGQKGVFETINRAAWMRVDGVFRMGELPPLPAPVAMDIGFDLFSENYRARLGDFVVVTGVPGLGKSTFVNDLCCRLVMKHGVTVAWASFEQAPQRDHRRALRSWYGVDDVMPDRRVGRPAYQMTPQELDSADAWIDRHHVFIVPNEDDDVTLDWILDRMEVAVIRFGARVIVIDPWNEMDHQRLASETTTEYVGRAIKTLKRFARKFQIHLIVVAHPTKSLKVDGVYKPPTLYDISDSANWYNKCDLGIIVHRPDEENTDIKVQKSRYHEEIGRPGEVRMQYCKEDRRFREMERIA